MQLDFCADATKMLNVTSDLICQIQSLSPNMYPPQTSVSLKHLIPTDYSPLSAMFSPRLSLHYSPLTLSPLLTRDASLVVSFHLQPWLFWCSPFLFGDMTHTQCFNNWPLSPQFLQFDQEFVFLAGSWSCLPLLATHPLWEPMQAVQVTLKGKQEQTPLLPLMSVPLSMPGVLSSLRCWRSLLSGLLFGHFPSYTF